MSANIFWIESIKVTKQGQGVRVRDVQCETEFFTKSEGDHLEYTFCRLLYKKLYLDCVVSGFLIDILFFIGGPSHEFSWNF